MSIVVAVTMEIRSGSAVFWRIQQGFDRFEILPSFQDETEALMSFQSLALRRGGLCGLSGYLCIALLPLYNASPSVRSFVASPDSPGSCHVPKNALAARQCGCLRGWRHNGTWWEFKAARISANLRRSTMLHLVACRNVSIR